VCNCQRHNSCWIWDKHNVHVVGLGKALLRRRWLGICVNLCSVWGEEGVGGYVSRSFLSHLKSTLPRRQLVQECRDDELELKMWAISVQGPDGSQEPAGLNPYSIELEEASSETPGSKNGTQEAPGLHSEVVQQESLRQERVLGDPAEPLHPRPPSPTFSQPGREPGASPRRSSI
jgi:hypothetical protein